MVLDETIGLLRTLHGEGLADIRIERIVVGVFFTGVKLSDGSGGVAYTPAGDLHGHTCCHSMAAERPFPARLKGATASEILNMRGNTTLGRLVTLVVMNALSARFLTPERYPIAYDLDALDLVDVKRAGKIAMIGAFIPFLKVLKAVPNIDLAVIEQKKETLKADEMRFYSPAEEAPRILPGCDTVIVTGAAISNGTIDDLLSRTRPGAQVIIAGPTASILPDALFARNASLVSGVRVIDIDLALDLIAEGLGAFHLFHRSVRKINIAKEQEGLRLGPSTRREDYASVNA